ncbi:MAG: hypothetical protein RBR22_11025 [Desulfuromonas sp.]|nr:hypothetical protein [Desulfuromonas sp.]
MRYAGYDIKQNTDPTSVTGALVAQYLTLKEADGVTDIVPFTYNSSTSSRSGLVTMQLAIEKDEERITLLHQVHVDNAP